ncbi:hypothetical protein ABW19_dt0203156 [Dactylella cylindrospora]|nr:hypothetical protein ABW19_dt0203156 [Dactylella cylindrospora]
MASTLWRTLSSINHAIIEALSISPHGCHVKKEKLCYWPHAHEQLLNVPKELYDLGNSILGADVSRRSKSATSELTRRGSPNLPLGYGAQASRTSTGPIRRGSRKNRGSRGRRSKTQCKTAEAEANIKSILRQPGRGEPYPQPEHRRITGLTLPTRPLQYFDGDEVPPSSPNSYVSANVDTREPLTLSDQSKILNRIIEENLHRPKDKTLDLDDGAEYEHYPGLDGSGIGPTVDGQSPYTVVRNFHDILVTGYTNRQLTENMRIKIEDPRYQDNHLATLALKEQLEERNYKIEENILGGETTLYIDKLFESLHTNRKISADYDLYEFKNIIRSTPTGANSPTCRVIFSDKDKNLIIQIRDKTIDSELGTENEIFISEQLFLLLVRAFKDHVEDLKQLRFIQMQSVQNDETRAVAHHALEWAKTNGRIEQYEGVHMATLRLDSTDPAETTLFNLMLGTRNFTAPQRLLRDYIKVFAGKRISSIKFTRTSGDEGSYGAQVLLVLS